MEDESTVRLETFTAVGEKQTDPSPCPGSAGCGFRPGAEEDEAEGRPLLRADLAHRGRPEAAAAHRAEHLCTWRPGAHRSGQESAEYGVFPVGAGCSCPARRPPLSAVRCLSALCQGPLQTALY